MDRPEISHWPQLSGTNGGILCKQSMKSSQAGASLDNLKSDLEIALERV